MEPAKLEKKSAPSSIPRRAFQALLVFVALVVLVTVARSDAVTESIQSALDWIEGQGLLGAVVFVAVYIAATIVAVPGSLLSLGAGAAYGFWPGFALVSLASTLGATAAFLIARYVARGWVARRIADNPRFRALDDGVAAEGWKLVLLTRLSPIFPFNLQNYGYGLTQIPAMHYVLASWIGMMPGTMMIVYVGHAVGSVAKGRERTSAEWTVLALGLVATIAVAIVAARIARRALARTSTET
jgi:uncharacterized membrane protein YdjX (TVP38/TMEM64 family)